MTRTQKEKSSNWQVPICQSDWDLLHLLIEQLIQATAITLLLAGKNPLVQEGEGGHCKILKCSKTLNFQRGEVNRSTLNGNLHQPRLPTVVGRCNLNFESASPFRGPDFILGNTSGLDLRTCPAIQGDPDSSITGDAGRVYYTGVDLLLI
jgi:hypothetical protein